jgi:hypothetical protein
MLAKHGSLESTGPDLTSYTRYERHENECKINSKLTFMFADIRF